MYRDRHDAGRRLAQALVHYTGARDTIILALPRGGVVIGYELSLVLHLPLDVLITRKLGTPGNPELAMGALAETGYRHLNPDVIRTYGISRSQLEAEVRRQQAEIDRRVERYRGGRPLPALENQTVLLVDDGIATGATFYASLGAIRMSAARRLVAALPVAPPEAVHQLKALVDEAVVLHAPAVFFAIGQFYQEFTQVEDEQVVACLEQVRRSLQKESAHEKQEREPTR
jgi:putative phosphoribosyl transferase